MLGDTAPDAQRAELLGGADTASLVPQAYAWTIGIGRLFGLLGSHR